MEEFTQLRPLPSDILSLSSNETACEYCGISYLLLNKYEKMLSQVSSLEEKLARFQQYETERPNLLTQLSTLTARNQAQSNSLANLSSKIIELETTNAQLSSQYAASITTLATQNSQLSSKITELEASNSNLSSQYSSKISKLETRNSLLSSKISNCIRPTLLSLSATLSTMKSELQCTRLQSTKLIISSSASSFQLLSSALSNLSSQHVTLSTSLSSQINDLLLQKRDFESEIIKLTNSCRQTAAKSSTTMQQLNNSLSSAQLECESLRNQLTQVQAQQSSNSTSASTAMAAKDATIHRQHKEIEQLTAQIAALHLDKTRTVEAHQSRVRQLQDKFLADLEAGQNRKEIEWVGEMKLMRAELDREMALKLDAAQREAHEKAVEEMKKEYEAVVDMIKSQAKRDARERDLEKEAAAAEAAARLAKEVQEARDEAKREQQLRMQAEIDSLSRKLKEVKDEADAGNLHSHHHHQSSISKLQSQLADLTLQQQQCQLLLHSREKEISFLKNTVRLECEERMDLLSKVERLERRVSLSSSSTTIIANTLTNAPSAPSPSPSDPGPTPPASFTNQNKSSSHRSSLPNMSKGGTRGFIPPHLLAKIKSVNK